ncbi:MAG: hypothetical protein ACRCTK_05725, partial [Alphaproteobacteria bacterium]
MWDFSPEAFPYALKNPGEALVAVLATQVATVNAIRPLTDEFLINQNTTGTQINQSVAALGNGNTFVTWQGNQAGAYDVLGRVFSAIGAPLGDELRINQNAAGDQSKPSVAPLGNGKIFVVWQSNQNGNLEVYGRFFSENGSVLSNQIKINQVTDGKQANASVTALSNGNAFIVWDGDQTGAPSLYGRLMASNGTFLGDEISLSRTLTGIQIDPQGK